jgi:hypothetical protein
VSQQVTVPDTTNPTLTFWYDIWTQDWTGVDSQHPTPRYDVFAVSLDESTYGSWLFDDGASSPNSSSAGCNLDHLGWKEGTVSLSPYKGQVVTVYFSNWNWDETGNTTGYYNTYTYLDDVAVNP